mmetsp:Transcript_50114/g.89962  ORF Transcript_50114/g.89962 Transcript_50114/m.89962 type:complete len:226 (+) Transcript_50114:1049-1726(+)
MRFRRVWMLGFSGIFSRPATSGVVLQPWSDSLMDFFFGVAFFFGEAFAFLWRSSSSKPLSSCLISFFSMPDFENSIACVASEAASANRPSSPSSFALHSLARRDDGSSSTASSASASAFSFSWSWDLMTSSELVSFGFVFTAFSCPPKSLKASSTSARRSSKSSASAPTMRRASNFRLATFKAISLASKPTSFFKSASILSKESVPFTTHCCPFFATSMFGPLPQ